MDKKVAGLIGAISVLGAAGGAQASTVPLEAVQANSFAELLAPIPNAAAVLQAVDAARTDVGKESSSESTNELVAQYYHHHHHHHYYYHHHHHHYYYHHHHHHHYY